MTKYYAVRKGRQTGVFETWAECQKQIIGFSGAEFKSFPTRAEAQAFAEGAASKEAVLDVLPSVYAFTDGSFNTGENRYGYGGFLHYSETEEDIPLRGHGDGDYADSRNVAGEVFGAIAAMQQAVALGLSEMTLFYDYEGVAKWPTGVWKANKPISQRYVEEYRRLSDKLTVDFRHVKAHTGIPGNELADQMAKEEAGVD
jgi:ribonuclease HI